MRSGRVHRVHRVEKAGIVVANPATLVPQGNLAAPTVLLALAGIGLTAILVARRIPGAIVLSIVVLTLVGLFVPTGSGGFVTPRPDGIFSLPNSPAPTFLALNFDLFAHDLVRALPITLTLLIVDLFDNIGTLIGVTKRAGLLRSDGTLPKAGRALLSDSLAAILSALFGTSTVVSYIESASGVEAGGRTGLTALTTAACFLLALFLTPLLLIIPAAATAPALIIVGVFMFKPVAEIRFDDFTEALPAIVTVLCIPLTFSIADGLALGVLCLVAVRLGTGQARSLPRFTYLLAGLFLLHLAGR